MLAVLRHLHVALVVSALLCLSLTTCHAVPLAPALRPASRALRPSPPPLVAVASVAVLNVTMYYNTGCTGGVEESYVHLAGQCNGYGQAWFCSPDGSIAYEYEYVSPDCSGEVSSISPIALNECNPTTNTVAMCSNAAAGPPPPMKFPPAGWALQTFCITPDGERDLSCPHAKNSSCTIWGAYAQGICRQSGDGQSSYLMDCFSDPRGILYSGSIDFLDSLTCEGAPDLGLFTTYTCPGSSNMSCSAYPPMSSLPISTKSGMYAYSQPNCASSPEAPPTLGFQVSGVCFQGGMLKCSADGTQASVLQFDNDACEGAPTSHHTYPTGVCEDMKIFFCRGPSSIDGKHRSGANSMLLAEQ